MDKKNVVFKCYSSEDGCCSPWMDVEEKTMKEYLDYLESRV